MRKAKKRFWVAAIYFLSIAIFMVHTRCQKEQNYAGNGSSQPNLARKATEENHSTSLEKEQAQESVIPAKEELGLESALILLLDHDSASYQKILKRVKELGGRVTVEIPPEMIYILIPSSKLPELKLLEKILVVDTTPVETNTAPGLNQRQKVFLENWNNKLKRKSEPTLVPNPQPPPNDRLERPPLKPEEIKPIPPKALPQGADTAGTGLSPMGNAAIANAGTGLSPMENAAIASTVAMSGKVAVSIFFPESNGSIDSNQENWTSGQVNNVVNKITSGVMWWATLAPAAENLSFVITYYDPLTEPCMSTGYEPITHPQSDQSLWINQIMTCLGYSTGDIFSKVDSYNAWLKSNKSASEAYSVFVVNDANDSDHKFSDGYFAYTYPGGPFEVMTYGNDGYGIANMGAVHAHETGHIFHAMDEYVNDSYKCNCSDAYNNCSNLNCANGCNLDSPCIMRGQVSPFNNYSLCDCTRGQIGWLSGCGNCLLQNCIGRPNGTPCDNNLFCDGADYCIDGICTGGSGRDCSDGISCTTDTCNESADRCDHVPNNSLCPSDNNPCTDEVCTPGIGCQSINNSSPCNDNIACNGTDSCKNGTCSQHSGSCSPTTCSSPDGTACDNGFWCDGSDYCIGGICTGGTPGARCHQTVTCIKVNCNEQYDRCDEAPDDSLCPDDGNVCTTEKCTAGIGCQHIYNNNSCDDGKWCNGVDICNSSNGSCIHSGDPCAYPSICDEANDRCITISCYSDADCDDGDLCTNDRCNSPGNADSMCLHENICPVACSYDFECDDGQVCTTDICYNPGTSSAYCSNINNSASCDNGIYCDGTDTCSGGICTHSGSPCAGCTESLPHCSCTPNCAGRICGPDPTCGQSCGSCSPGYDCDSTGQCIQASSCAYDIDTDTIAMWHFNEASGTTAFDSKGSNNGQVNSATWQSPGKCGSALSFNGNSGVNIKKPFSGINNIWTIEMYFKTDSPQGSYNVGGHLYRHRAPYNDVTILLQSYSAPGVPGLGISAWTAGGGIVFNTNYADNLWHHVAFVADGSYLRLYYDKTEVGTSAISKNIDWDTGYVEEDIGDDPYDGGTRGFIGMIDEVRISSLARTYTPCVCDSGACCDGCNYRASSYACSTTNEYGCPYGTGCDSDAYTRIATTYCSGSSLSCNGSVSYGSWSLWGNCPSTQKCSSGSCVDDAACVCTPDCSGKECGDDGCGGSCGSCSSGYACNAYGQCICTPNCSGRICGPDPVCGQSCGACSSGTCNASGKCESHHHGGGGCGCMVAGTGGNLEVISYNFGLYALPLIFAIFLYGRRLKKR